MRTVFLLGSGISIDAQMPCVSAITAQIISGDGAWLHSDKTFVIDADNPNYDLCRPRVEPVLALVHELRGLAADFFGREPNYEEISQLASQLHDALSGEYESAAVMPLVAQLMRRPYVHGDGDRLIELTDLVLNYIADTVHAMLSRNPARLDHLDAIIEACRRLPSVDLATLNHDRVLEAALSAAGIVYADGFEKTTEDVHFWLDDWDEARVRLLKLHGSLDWWGYQIADEPWRGWVTARYQGSDAMHPKRSGALAYPHELRPVFLTGTFDKILAYETWVFPDQHLRFHQALREAHHVVVLGYGFGDKAINTRLIAWLARRRRHRLIVGHPDPDRLRTRARPAVRDKWNRWTRDGQLVIVPAYVADLDYDAIAAHLA